MNQIEKDEEAKRRVSAAMKGVLLPGGIDPKSAAPPMQLVGRPPSGRNSPQTLTPSKLQDRAAQEERDAESKRRASGKISAVWPSDFNHENPPCTPPVHQKEALKVSSSSSWSPNSSNGQRTPTTYVPIPLPKFHKSSTSPRGVSPRPSPRSSSPSNSTGEQQTPKTITPVPSLKNLKAHQKSPSIRLSPRVEAARSQSALGTANNNNKRSSLPYLPLAPGDKKPPKSLPPRTNGTGTVPASPHRRMGDTKYRISLPTNAATVAAAPVAATQQHRLSMPVNTESAVLAAAGASSPYRRMGERKQRVSLPPGVILGDISTTSATTTATNSEHSTPGAEAVEAGDDAGTPGRSSISSQSPQKGLRTNRMSSTNTIRNNPPPPLPVAMGPGAFDVPFSMVTDYVEGNNGSQGTDGTTMPGSVVAMTKAANEKTNGKNVYDIERGLFSDETTSNTVVDQSVVSGSVIAVQSTTAARRPTKLVKPHKSLSVKKQPKLTDGMDDEELEEKGVPCYRSCFWCSIVLPIVVLGAIIALVASLVVVLGPNKEDELSLPDNATAVDDNVDDVPAVDAFATIEVPSFTLEVWEDPSSDQYKAKNWLEKDPNAGKYSNAQTLQRFALATLHFATNGARWKNATYWLDYDHHECEWSGASCNDEMEYKSLFLGDGGLRGTLPKEISLLTAMVDFNVASNTLFGNIPSELAAMQGLESLTLSMNELESTLPDSLVQLSDSLVHLYLDDNKFTGSVPSWLGQMTELKTLLLGSNKLGSTFPSEIGRCQQLTVINVGSCSLTGQIPSEIGLLSQLTFLGVPYNKFDSTIPVELANLARLNTFYASQAGLRGTVPREIGGLTELEVLAIGGNQFEQSIPTEIGGLRSLEYLYLDDAKLTGPIPSEIGLLKELVVFHASANQLSSTIPSELGLLKNLTEFDVQETNVVGAFSAETCALVAAGQLSLAADCGEVTCCAGS